MLFVRRSTFLVILITWKGNLIFDFLVEDKLHVHKQHCLEASANSHSLSADCSETPPDSPYSEPAMILGYVQSVWQNAWCQKGGEGVTMSDDW